MTRKQTDKSMYTIYNITNYPVQIFQVYRDIAYTLYFTPIHNHNGNTDEKLKILQGIKISC